MNCQLLSVKIAENVLCQVTVFISGVVTISVVSRVLRRILLSKQTYQSMFLNSLRTTEVYC